VLLIRPQEGRTQRQFIETSSSSAAALGVTRSVTLVVINLVTLKSDLSVQRTDLYPAELELSSYAECRYAKCRYAGCCGTVATVNSDSFFNVWLSIVEILTFY
jgi:hypothetical protein